MSLKQFTETMLPAVEIELQRVVKLLQMPGTAGFEDMLSYHMGWTGEGAGPEAQGKRIRPLILLLTCSAAGGDWQSSLPAAVSVELIHNFSLVHDDIQDQSELRRGRPTVWKKWGLAHAINAGDALFILAQLALLDLANKYPAELTNKISVVMNKACLALSSGQFMDMSFEKQKNLTIEDYWQMVSGKTAALLAASTHIGALLGDIDETIQEAYRDFGHYLGLAFQAQDDYLGIWGNSALTGKSTESDLVTGKKSLPILFGLNRNGKFTKRWNEGAAILPNEVPNLAEQLSEEGAKLFTQETGDQMMDLAIQALRVVDPKNEAGEALFELAHWLLDRQA